MTNTNIVKGSKVREWLNVNGFVKIGGATLNNKVYEVFKNDETNYMLGFNEKLMSVAFTNANNDIVLDYGKEDIDVINLMKKHYVEGCNLEIEEEDFNIIENVFEDDKDMLEDIIGSALFDEEIYIYDTYNQSSDDFVPIYNHDLCAKAWELNEYVQMASEEGLIPSNESIDLFSILRMGAYEYYTKLAYENDLEIRVNFLVRYIEENESDYPNLWARKNAFVMANDVIMNWDTFGEIVANFEEHYEEMSSFSSVKE